MSQQKRGGFGFSGFSLGPKRPKIETPVQNEDEPVVAAVKKSTLPPSALLNEDEFSKFKTSIEPSSMLSSKNETPTSIKPSIETPTQQNTTAEIQKTTTQQPASEDDDPLDAFMAAVTSDLRSGKEVKQPKLRRDDIEDEDDQETLFKYLAEKEKEEGYGAVEYNPDADSDEEVYRVARALESKANDQQDMEYDSDGNPTWDKKKDKIGPIAPLDHTQIEYDEFNKDFYTEHPDIAKMTDDEVTAFRRQNNINVSGVNVPRPIKEFSQAGFDAILMNEIKKQEFSEPTNIQKQALPAALSGRDVIGIAKTGSGKTAAFVWPMIVHAMDQPVIEKGQGPIAIICAPTRELASQIYTEARKYSKGYGMHVAAIYGGLAKIDQIKTLKAGVEVVVGTPGRIIDMIKLKALKMTRVTYLVLDEADKMFDMGFEPQIRSIVGQIRPDRQTLLFSATFKKRVEQLAREILTDPVRITIGNAGDANEDITQVVHVLNDDNAKWPWLSVRIAGFLLDGSSVLLFVSQKGEAEELATKLKNAGFHAACIHGDKDQQEREKIMFAFKNQNLPILVATDVAARGLDIKSVKTVINYDTARSIEAHTHRIGRTGRAGTKDGVAYTLITRKENNFASDLVRNLEGANQPVPPELIEVAMQNAWFKKQRSKLQGRKGGRPGGPPSTLNNNNSTASDAFPPGTYGLGRGRGRGIGFIEQSATPSYATPVSSFGSGRPVMSGGAYNREAMMAQFQASFKKSTDTSMMANYTPKPTPPPAPVPQQAPPVAPQQVSQGNIPPPSSSTTSSSSSSYSSQSDRYGRDNRVTSRDYRDSRDRRDDRDDRRYDRDDRDRKRDRDDRDDDYRRGRDDRRDTYRRDRDDSRERDRHRDDPDPGRSRQRDDRRRRERSRSR